MFARNLKSFLTCASYERESVDNEQRRPDRNDLLVFHRTISKFRATLDESRGRVTVQLSSKNAVQFFEIVRRERIIQELKITLDFSPSTDQIRKLRHAIKESQVSRLTISIDPVGDKYTCLGVIRK
ncbi:hypothetical protein BGZ96_006658, partial [Linnemannia gamsii]